MCLLRQREANSASKLPFVESMVQARFESRMHRMLGSSKALVGLSEFRRLYRAEIQHRHFVEEPEYYRNSEERFWQGFRRIQNLGLPPGTNAIDIGGGITGVLVSKLLGFRVTVADVNEEARADVEEMGLGFVALDLFCDEVMPVSGMDLVILQEVLEHIPRPPYVVLEKIKTMLNPGGLLFLTTPNGHRLRNVLYMLAGREIVDIYRYPGPGDALGHQHEYTMKQLLWQAHKAKFEVMQAEYYQDGWRGSSRAARLAWKLSKPTGMLPRLRNNISMILRNPISEN